MPVHTGRPFKVESCHHDDLTRAAAKLTLARDLWRLMSDRRAGPEFESPAFRVQNSAARASAAIVCYWNLTRTAGPTVTVTVSESG
jgi:hypothetical protein